jgi:hypothetical protein
VPPLNTLPAAPTRRPTAHQARNVTYQHSHGKPMSCPATAQLLSNTLYNRRFFPLFTFNLCAGLDEEGERTGGGGGGACHRRAAGRRGGCGQSAGGGRRTLDGR